jgi:hypothetical protein
MLRHKNGKASRSNAVPQNGAKLAMGCMLAQAQSVAAPPVGRSSARQSNLAVALVKGQGVGDVRLLGVTYYQYMQSAWVVKLR